MKQPIPKPIKMWAVLNMETHEFVLFENKKIDFKCAYRSPYKIIRVTVTPDAPKKARGK